MSDETHYCIYCGSKGTFGDKCEPCNHYRGKCGMRPTWTMQREGSFMGRKLAYVGWPWQEDPHAPYIPAPEPWPRKSSYPPREYVVFVK